MAAGGLLPKASLTGARPPLLRMPLDHQTSLICLAPTSMQRLVREAALHVDMASAGVRYSTNLADFGGVKWLASLEILIVKHMVATCEGWLLRHFSDALALEAAHHNLSRGCSSSVLTLGLPKTWSSKSVGEDRVILGDLDEDTLLQGVLEISVRG